jgi:sulfide:quinone oxidoreductase
MPPNDHSPLKVLIAGGGVAGLEAALALRALAGDRIAATILAPDPEFVYRPMRVREPFGSATARHYPLNDIALDIGVELKKGAFKWLEPDKRLLHTEDGDALAYDVLLLAMGATPRPHYAHAVTLDDRRLDDQLHGLIQDVEGGYSRKLAFLVPTVMAWPLPIYELALMTARRAWDMNEEAVITVVTPEDAPLAVFGGEVSSAVEQLLEDNRVQTITSAHAEMPKPGQVEIHPGPRSLSVDRAVALPDLYGPSAPGVPTTADRGFVQVDAHCRVLGLDHVYAAGDATDFPVKFGGVAAQQADTAAQSIAATAGAPVEPTPFDPEVHAMLLGGDRPLYISAHLTGGHGASARVSDTPTWSPANKIAARYLAPYLESRDQAGVR